MEWDEHEFEFQSKYADDLEALADFESELTADENVGCPLSDPGLTSSTTSSKRHDSWDTPVGDGPTLKRPLAEERSHEVGSLVASKSAGNSPLNKRPRHDPVLRDVLPVTADFSGSRLLTLDEVEKIGTSRQVLRRIPPGGYVSSTSDDGTRLYMRLLPDSDGRDQKLFRETVTKTHQLLPKSFSVMYKEILKEREQQLLKDIASEDSRRQSNHRPIDTGGRVSAAAENSDCLWVEKFKPAGYLDLLSDDGTNRALLRWLKLWDKVVFNLEVKSSKLPPGPVAPGYHSKQQPAGSPNFQPGKFQRKNALSDINLELDFLNCPRQKIALLCGPPGLGKTTLAHVIATHAGYNVVEMNASDDRSPEAFRIQIEAATQMRSVLGHNPRPNCLIIDEIDGAPLTAINVLMAVISNKAHEEQRKVQKKRRQDEFGPLLRPIVCICNDQYVPALRPLRSRALMLTFPPTSSVRLATRLMEVSLCQRLKTDMSALLALCAKADNDIRSCLSTLQFVQGKQSTLRMADVRSLSIGQKDIQKSLFSVWQDIFHIPRNTSQNVAKTVEDSRTTSFDRYGVHSLEDSNSLSARFYKILGLVQSYGEYSKINQGLFENYLNLNYKEHRLTSTSLGCDWLCFSDILEKEVLHLQNYSLMGYVPYSAVAFHLLFSVGSFPKLIYPSSQFELKTKFTKSLNIVNGLINETAAALRPFVNVNNLVSDVLPLLVKIIQPKLRPVNTQLYNSREKADLLHCIEVMILFNLTFLQHCNPEGQFSYSLNPEIDVVGCFYPGSNSQEMSYASKQMIAREIDIEKMRRSDPNKEDRISVPAPRPAAPKEPLKQDNKPNLPNHQQTLKPKVLTKKTIKQTVDFFGRVITKPQNSAGSKSKGNGQQLGDGDIWFRFKEGYSNAVRKTVRVGDLV